MQQTVRKAAQLAKAANIIEMQKRIGELLDSLLVKLDELDNEMVQIQEALRAMGLDVEELKTRCI